MPAAGAAPDRGYATGEHACQLGPVAVHMFDYRGTERIKLVTAQMLPAAGISAHSPAIVVLISEARPLAVTSDGSGHICPANSLMIQTASMIEAAAMREEGRFWLLVIAEPFLRSLLPNLGDLYNQPIACERGAGAMLVDMLGVIRRHAPALSRTSRLAIVDQICGLLVSAVSDGRQGGALISSVVRENHIDRIRAYITENLSRPNLCAEDIARGCGISKRYLHDLFRETGTSVGAWIRSQRLARAKSHLRDPMDNRPISCLAYDLGFASQAQFSRTFKAQFGMAPSDYRQAASGASRNDGTWLCESEWKREVSL